MARLAVFTSGNGSNFQAIAEKISETSHTIPCMICDRKNAFSFSRAENLKIKSYYVKYYGRSIEESENEILDILKKEKIDFIALAGFMRLLSEKFIENYRNRIINIHPALLPKFPGTHAIERSFTSQDKELGITIHYVDKGMDTGPVILQHSFTRNFNATIEEIEKKIHNLEYTFYPDTVEKLLDSLDK
jgi:phosphoribosylglycinamide formyltransferase-1